MKQRSLTTRIWLPPGALPNSVIRKLSRKIFEEYRWFRPMRYGGPFLDKRVDPEHLDYDALVAYYERFHDITVAARTDRDFFLIYPARNPERPYIGSITWMTSIKEAV